MITKIDGSVKLTEEQVEALSQLHNGSVLVGGVGSGKTYVSIFWYLNTAPDKHLYVITTASNRDMIKPGHEKSDWAESIEACGIDESRYTIDSWNNIAKYKEIENSCFIFDEQRVVGYGKWGRAFIRIAKLKEGNDWIMASATPGDVWMDWVCIFIANDFFFNKTDFTNKHVEWNPYTPYPTVKDYKGTALLEKYRRSIVVTMGDKRKTVRHRDYVLCDYDLDKYNMVARDRFNYLTELPIANASEYTQVLRRVCAESVDRIRQFERLLDENKTCIIFYNYNYERDIIRMALEARRRPYGEWNGNRHTSIPEGREWAYIVQYNGAEGWNCTTTNCVIFYSVNYSYKKMEQAEGRIDRINTKYKDLWYYYLTSRSVIDVRVLDSVENKKKFNESMFAKKYGGFYNE